ncbi:type III-A CRISPR-associated protein Cas10/Csm1 [Clostridium sp. MD294]|uniref:type III-A CRISPR-associated protein Cas10/Csm1 n=1 Tax=Clostridium sp. MD294 TaxID=97138 RepID=UPI0002CB34B8|nr:type III-A CRISPR-associated protein Cas10/Csm1 [Clostridium sp. MD294]NDO45316.1 type III-A CRISPR-associated protein Cas10/Csm1 [Clostridium sp. MD294]USF31047.1 CRISPR system single-strand-specific deoxyribonuclease Cas10/Csm1 (subtype III-A) [Clostridium sp. MD294]
MNDTEYLITIGGLLHDVGKLLYRYNDKRNHSISGFEFIQKEADINDVNILEQIHYHHAALLKNAKLADNSLAYITCIADNISAAADRRKSNEEGWGFVREIPLESIFNRLNGNDENKKYPPAMLDKGINYPIDEKNKTIKYNQEFYGKCVNNIKNCIKAIEYDENYINSLLEVLEANISFIPSSTSINEVADISLFDHSKTTAAIACCIYQYLKQNNIINYKSELFLKSNDFYHKKVFLLYSMDISGIQDFIYTISTDKALKNLRARSFYIELIMEHIIDELLCTLSLSRANLLYCGGGHAYMILSNTEKTIKVISDYEKEINDWFLKNFGTALYIAGGFASCSANDLKNEPQGSYGDIFKNVSNNISQKKSSRYTASDIIKLNDNTTDGERECSVCRKTEKLNDNQRCSICEVLENFSNDIINKQFFSVVKKSQGLPMPRNMYILADDKRSLIQKMTKENYVRAYCKNKMHTGFNIVCKLWVGDYKNGDTFEDLAKAANGIARLGVLRADIDNLGQAFVCGFESNKNKDTYVTISRTATFSRKLSMFFKLHINEILANGQYCTISDKEGERNIAIVYSGGDDVFVVGAWDDVIEFAIDLNDALSDYAQGTLTISAGIGIYPQKYPISTMAIQTGELEELSKQYPDKNAITLFGEGNTYHWDTFVNDVLEDKYLTIKDFFESIENKNSSTARGKAFLYRLLELMKNREEKINLARFAYVLSRLQPNEEEDKQASENYNQFAKKMYHWIRDEEQCRQVITAIYIYIYSIREREEE